MIKSLFRAVNLSLLLWSLSIPAGAVDAPLKDIETAIIEKDYEKAKELAAQRLSDTSAADQNAELRYYLALCELRLDQYAQARTLFTELISQKMDAKLRDKAYLGLFDAYYMDEYYEEALDIAQRLLKISPDSEFLSLIYLKYARANLRLAQWREARAYLEKITDDFPDSLEVHVARQLLNEKQYFAVQVGAFMERARAEELAHELQQKGQYAYIVETADEKNRKFYRVRVGQLVLLNEAQRLESKLSQEGYPTQIYP